MKSAAVGSTRAVIELLRVDFHWEGTKVVWQDLIVSIVFGFVEMWELNMSWMRMRRWMLNGYMYIYIYIDVDGLVQYSIVQRTLISSTLTYRIHTEYTQNT